MQLTRQLRLGLLACVVLLASAPLSAQILWDTTGNGLLNGAFRFREANWITDNEGTDDLVQAVSVFGTITFDGAGNYSVNASAWDSGAGAIQNVTYNGTYAMSAAGYGFINRAESLGGNIVGSVAEQVFVGSPTEEAVNGLFIAARSHTNLTSGNFSQPYIVAYMNFPNLRMSEARDGTFRLSPNGTGGIPAANLTGYIGGDLTARVQALPSATYTVNGGVGTLNFGGVLNATTILAGSMEVYTSPDGEFLFGGSRTGWDMFFAVRAPTGQVAADALSGAYYHAGVDLNRTDLDDFYPQLDTYQGSFTSVPSVGALIGHQRLLVAPDTAAFDYNYAESITLDAQGQHVDLFGNQHQISNNRRFQVGYGTGDFLGVHVSIAIPAQSGSGPFINPTGVLNAGSFTPFTAGLSRGAVVTIFGTGLAGSTLADSTFPTTLGGVQVRVNGRLAPVYVVSPTQISFVIPYDTEVPVAGIQVTNNGVNSNRVTVYMNEVSPGVFTNPANGIGIPAALHVDYSLVNQANPARRGETIAIYLTGLGDVDPPWIAGRPAPVDPLSRVKANLNITVDGLNAPVAYKGLAPTLGGLYQINITIPNGAADGLRFLEISGPDAFSSQVQLPIGGSVSDERSVPSARAASAETEPLEGDRSLRPSRGGRQER